jgi:hypothetical protein
LLCSHARFHPYAMYPHWHHNVPLHLLHPPCFRITIPISKCQTSIQTIRPKRATSHGMVTVQTSRSFAQPRSRPTFPFGISLVYGALFGKEKRLRVGILAYVNNEQIDVSITRLSGARSHQSLGLWPCNTKGNASVRRARPN